MMLNTSCVKKGIPAVKSTNDDAASKNCFTTVKRYVLNFSNS